MNIGALVYLFWLKSAESLCAYTDFLSINCPRVYMPSTHVDTYTKIPQFRSFDLSPIIDILKCNEIYPWIVHNRLVYGVMLS